jgi:hypothetical protein
VQMVITRNRLLIPDLETSSAFKETEDKDDGGNDCEEKEPPDSSPPIVLELELVLVLNPSVEFLFKDPRALARGVLTPDPDF